MMLPFFGGQGTVLCPPHSPTMLVLTETGNNDVRFANTVEVSAGQVINNE